MPNTALNRTTAALLTNKSGGALAYGDVVVLDNTNANGFTTTTTSGLSTREIGVILEPNGIANNASGMVATGGWIPKVTLNTAATVGQFIKSHTVAGQGTPHSSPQVEGDFGVALDASATPTAILFGSPNPPSGATVSKLVQVVNTQTGAVATGTTVLPLDDTIPQNTEGTEFMTLAVTPTSATNKLRVEVVVLASLTPAPDNLIVALFQDTTADALAAAFQFIGTSTAATIVVFSHYMTSGTTSSTTFKVRAGMNGAGTVTFNGQSGSRKLGGVIASSITISEIVP